MEKYIYKIRHKETGKFVRVKLMIEGIHVWKEKDVINSKSSGYGQVLYDTHKGWNTPPVPTNEDFNLIGCEIVKYKVSQEEL